MERMQRPGHSEIQLSKVTISGRVLDESGFPLAGATIQEKETANGAIADSEGKFTLVVADNAVLRVSFIGYMSQDIEVEGHSTFHITLREDMIELDNVIVTALGIEKKENSLSYATDLIKKRGVDASKNAQLNYFVDRQVGRCACQSGFFRSGSLSQSQYPWNPFGGE